ncbi:MAG: hypothetical protein RJA25_1345 [Bacteroidota bacterium]|jgi:antitoxin component YwqK of YwqJK toxin-antitoxin module
MDKINLQLNVSTKFFWLLFLLTTFTACSNKQKVETKNKEGVVVESFYINKKNPEQKIGAYHKYYDDGKMMEESHYENGKLTGKRLLFYNTGKIMQSEHYLDNKYNGAFASYYEDGGLQQEGAYKDNMMNGVWKNYFQHPKNKLKEEITLKDNHVEGIYKEYYSNGNVHASGNKKEIMDGIDVFDGEVLIYDSLVNNKVIRKLHFENGKQISKEEVL